MNPNPINEYGFVSIKTKLIALFVSLIFIVLTILSFIFYNDAIYVLSQQTQEDAKIKLEENRKIISNVLAVNFSYLLGLSKNSLIVNSLIDMETRKSSLKIFMRDLEMPGNKNAVISMTNFRGEVLASNGFIFSYEEAPWLEQVSKGIHYTGTVKYDEKFYLVQALPIYYNSFVEGMLVAKIELSFLQNLLIKEDKEEDFFILDLNNNLKLLGDENLYQERILPEIDNLADEKIIEMPEYLIISYAFDMSEGFEIDWLIIDHIDKVVLKESIDEVKYKNFLIYFVALFFVVTAVYIFASNLLKPIILLTEHVKKISNGYEGLELEFDQLKSKDEIDELARSFEKMRSKLNDSYQELEKRVKSRTKSLKDSESRLLESEMRYALANKAANVGIWDWNVETNELIWDEMMYKLYGIKESDFSGAYEAWESAVHPDDKAAIVADLQECVKGNKIYDITFRVIWPDRSIHYIRGYGKYEKNDEGKVVRIIGTNWDITKTKKLEHETQMILDNVPAYIYYKNDNNKILRLNQTAADFMGLKVEDVQGKQAEEFFDTEMARKYLEDDLEVFSSKKAKLDIIEEMKLEDGKSLWIKTDKIPIADDTGEFKTILVVATDISELKRSQAELERSNQELEQFAYVASHDLQEPIRKIVGFADLFERSIEGELSGKSREYMTYVTDGARRMQNLIQDLLQYSRAGSTELTHQDVDVNKIVREVISNLEVLMSESNAKVNFDQLPLLTVHRSFLVRLFQNLITNSIKYKSEQDPVINISSNKIGLEWEFTVSDNGMGIPEEFAEKVFVIFQRLHGKTQYSGTGIGLAVCRRMVERLGGRIWLEQPENGVGVIFKFRLPIIKENIHV